MYCYNMKVMVIHKAYREFLSSSYYLHTGLLSDATPREKCKHTIHQVGQQPVTNFSELQKA